LSEAPRVVSVEILGQQYPIRSTLDADYVADLAAYVDDKIHMAADATSTTDTVRVAVLAALNIADEYFHLKEGERSRRGTVAERTARIERIVDEALAASDPAGA